MTAEASPSGNGSDRISEPNSPVLNRELISDLAKRTSITGACFGRDIVLTQGEREQVTLIADMAQVPLDTSAALLTKELTTYEALLQEGTEKGVLLSMVSHQNTRVPTFIVDGGESAVVKKVLRDDARPGIQVPTQLFWLIHWKNTVAALKGYGTNGVSDETLCGRSTKSLATALTQIGYYFTELGIIESKNDQLPRET